MAHSLRDNGLLQVWSPFFNLANKDMLDYAIRKMPVPSGKTVKRSDIDGVDISDEVDIILSRWPKDGDNFTSDVSIIYKDAEVNKAVVDMLAKIGNSEEIFVDILKLAKYGPESIDMLLKRVINAHTTYFSNINGKYNPNKPSTQEIGGIFRNIVIVRLGQIITDPRNLPSAQMPVAMGESRDAADSSPLGQESKVRTRMNPLTIPQTTYENLIGKSAIGVGANGQKSYFTILHYYMRLLSSGRQEDFARMTFDSKVVIDGEEYKFNILNSINTQIVEMEGNVEKMKLYLKSFLEKKGYTDIEIDQVMQFVDSTDIDPSIAISSLISAATDNAKELILKKINSETQYMNIYIYGVILGIPFNKIASLMTSPEVNMAIQMCKENMFSQNGKLYINSILNALSKGLDCTSYLSNNDQYLIKKALSEKYPEVYKFMERHGGLNTLIASLQRGLPMIDPNQDPAINPKAKQSDDIETLNPQMTLKEFEQLAMEVVSNRKSAIRMFKHLRNYAKVYSPFTSERVNAFLQLREGGQEVTTLASWLKINQGIPPVYGDFINYIEKLEYSIVKQITKLKSTALRNALKMFYDQCGYTTTSENRADRLLTREAYQDIISGNFKLENFLNPSNNQYRKDIVDLMEVTKVSFNVVAIVMNTPHIYESFKELFTGMICVSGNTSRLNLLRQIKKEIEKSMYVARHAPLELDKKQWRKISEKIDSQMIYEWLSQQMISFPVKEGQKVLEIKEGVKTIGFAQSDKIITLNDEKSIAQFKLWFESVLYPILKNPLLYTHDGSLSLTDKRKLMNNIVIRDLGRGSFYDNYAMTNVRTILLPNFTNNEDNDYMRQLKAIYQNEMRKLVDIQLFGRSVVEWLYLYNLVTFKNQNSPASMNPLFAHLFDEGLLQTDYFKSVGDSSYNMHSLLPKIVTDEFLKAIAPIVQAKAAADSEYIYIRVYNPTLRQYCLYKRNAKKGEKKSSPFDEYGTDPVDDAVDEAFEYTGREFTVSGYSFVRKLSDFIDLNYYRFELASYESKLIDMKITESTSKDQLLTKIAHLMKLNVLTINVNC